MIKAIIIGVTAVSLVIYLGIGTLVLFIQYLKEKNNNDL